MKDFWLTADWPAPEWVKTCVTTRQDGCSQGRFKGFNLGAHVGDDPHHVLANRAELARKLGCRVAWLEQTHSTDVVEAAPGQVEEADASWTADTDVACAIMTADCLPVLFCDRAGTRVAAAHAGWRGLAAGILENTVTTLGVPAHELLVWLGPAIGPEEFEVGPEVKDIFGSAAAAECFKPSPRPDHYLADIYQLARLRLQAMGVDAIYGGGLCTVRDSVRFYSYRRDGQTGRFASLIWRDSTKN
ncbi:MAG: peptidoglycan editing factor PgeF [Gammaproteobacteria bacterium]|jgi:YfiH family protein|nr:peptidoglycan editing factor PgeF [Gammaproteobacteria bacterium]